MVPVSIEGGQVRLAVRIFRPDGEEALPTLILHPGGAHRPDVAWQPDALIRYFVDRRWNVVLAYRRGLGGSEGAYDGGHTLNSASNDLADIDAITDAILAMPFVDRMRTITGGHSKGGALSVAHAGRKPALYRGVINFSGVFGNTSVNRTLFKDGARFGRETLWLYAAGDRIVSLRNARANFDAFQKAGGQGALASEFPGKTGHSLWEFPEHWGAAVESYLERLGLPHEPASSALRFSPDPSLPPTAFLGRWEGRWFGWSGGVPAVLDISSASSDEGVVGTFRRFEHFSSFSAPVTNGVFQIPAKSHKKATFDFFLAGKDVIICTYRHPKTYNRPRAFSRLVLTRAGD